MIKLSVGKSSAPDGAAAAREAAEQALQGAQQPIFALVLSTDQYNHEDLAAAMTANLPEIPWAGCCNAGVFAGDTLLHQGLVVGLFCSPDARVGVGLAGPVSKDGRTAGRGAVSQALAAVPALAGGYSRAIILLPDAVTGNGADVVRGAAEEAGSGLAWAGGGAGDNLRFVRTAQYAHGRAFQDHVVAIAIDAPGELGVGIRHGWRPYGPPCLVTRAQGATAIELDYEAAFEVYRRMVEHRGDRVSLESFPEFAMTHPLGIPQADGEHIIRDPLEVGLDGSLRCVAEVPDGSLIRIMEGNREALLASALAAASEAREIVNGPIGGAIVFDCVSRWLMLRDEIEKEFSAFRKGLRTDAPIIGCLTFGEVGALGGGVPQLHNKTAVLLAVPAQE